MDSCYLSDHIAEDHVHMDITTCNNEEQQQKYHLGTVSNESLWILHILLYPNPRP